MDPSFADTYIRPILARLLAIALLWVSSWTLKHFGVPISDEMQHDMTELAVGLVFYSLVHRDISIKTNPADAAKLPASEENPFVQPKEPDAKTSFMNDRHF